MCPRYNSLHEDVGSAGTDAFLQNWRGEANWCNPPWGLLPRLTSFLAARPDVEAVVLAPDWPNALWFRPLRRLAAEELLIRRQTAMFLPGDPSLPRPLPPPRWNLRAFHLRPRNPTKGRAQ